MRQVPHHRLSSRVWESLQHLDRLLLASHSEGLNWIRVCTLRLRSAEPCRMPTLTVAVLRSLIEDLRAAGDDPSLLPADRWIAAELERRRRVATAAAARRRQLELPTPAGAARGSRGSQG